MGRSFSQAQLNHVMEQGMVRQCACPSLLTRLLSDTRALHEYQRTCLESNAADRLVHAAIATTTERVSRILEECLIEVLAIEGWDVDVAGDLKMPPRLVELQFDAIACENLR